MTRALDEKSLIAMNVFLIQQDSPEEIVGVKDASALNMCVESINQSAFGVEVYPSMEEKASILYINLIKRHCFHNANKRTAHMALVYFLSVNGAMWKMSKGDSVEMAVMVATYEGEFDELKKKVVSLIKNNIKIA